jgi:hypothetical protein
MMGGFTRKVENVMGTERLEDLAWVYYSEIERSMVGGSGLYSCDSTMEPVAGSCEHGIRRMRVFIL